MGVLESFFKEVIMCGTMVVNMETVLADVQKELEFFSTPEALLNLKEANLSRLEGISPGSLGVQRLQAEINALKTINGT